MSPPATAPTLISPAEAGALAGVKQETILKWLSHPELAPDFPKAYRLTKRSLRLDLEEFLAWLASRKSCDRLAASDEAASGK